MNRPLLWLAFFFALGLWTAARGPFHPLAISAPLLFAGITLSVARSLPHRTHVAGMFLVLFASGAMYWFLVSPGLSGDALSRAVRERGVKQISVEGRVVETDLWAPGQVSARFILNVERAAFDNVETDITGRTQIRWYAPDRAIFAGERVRVSGSVDTSLSNVNPGVWSQEDNLRIRRVHTAVEVSGNGGVTAVKPARVWSPAFWIGRLRYAQAVRLQDCMPANVFPFVKSIWLGDRTGLSREDYNAYSRSGTIHILSVSGLHMAMVYASASAALSMVVRRRKIRAMALLGIIVAFVLMTGAAPATVRSGLMLGIFLIYELFDREPDAPSALGLSAVIMFVHDPHVLFDLGAQLSFLSIAGLTLFYARLVEVLETRMPSVFAHALGASLSSQLLTLPVSISMFHTTSLVSPLANVIIVPIVTGVLWLAFVAAVLGFISTGAASLFGFACVPLVWLVKSSAHTLSGTPVSFVVLTSPTWISIACFTGLAIWLYQYLRTGAATARSLSITGILLCAMVVFWDPWFPKSEAVFLDVGHGDATYVRTPGGTTFLIDGGNASENYDLGERVVAPFLLSRGVTRLDYVVATHNDSDHMGGLAYVLGNFRVGALVLGPGAAANALEDALLETAARRGIPIRRVTRGDVLAAYDANVDVLHPPGGEENSAEIDPAWQSAIDNDRSIVLRLRWPGLDLLMTGDIEFRAEQALAMEGCNASILRVPHHGSNTSSSEVFLGAVKPKVAVVSTGEFKGKLLLRDEIVERYRARDIPLWRTDVHGAVILRVNDGVSEFECERVRRKYIDSTYAQGR
jgi:competence protein ComEC